MINQTNIQPYYPPLSLQDERGTYNYMSTPNIYGLIRQLVQDTGGPYLEIGSYRGMSLLAAGAGTGVGCIGIDNFCGVGYRGDNETILREQIAPYEHIHLVNNDFRDALKILKNAKMQFSVIFIDGPHDYDGTLDQLKLSEKVLRKTGYIIIDDLNFAPVEHAMRDFLATGRGKKFDVVLYQKTSERQHPTWWNGIAVIERK